MPIHDWTRVQSGTFHNFHVMWTVAISNRLNAGLLPPGYFAMAEQVIGQPNADVVTLHPDWDDGGPSGVGTAVAPRPPRTRFVMPAEHERYARMAKHVAVHHGLGNVVAVIEIVSPGNKDSRHAIHAFVEKAVNLVRQGVNLLVVDLQPPTPRDPQGIHKAIWDEITDQPFDPPPDQPLTLASYQCEPTLTAFVEPVGVGQALLDMPLFLQGERYIMVPLEETYQATWTSLPRELQSLLFP